jgi:multicomponent Na+:H+ antiporter subunit D
MMFIAVPLGAAFTMLITYRFSRKLPDIIGTAVTFYLAASALSIYLFSNVNTVTVMKIGDFPYGMSINLILDGLSLFLLLIANVMAFIVTFYFVSYMEKYTGKEKFYTLLMLMIAGMNGVILTGDFFTLFIFMELASLSAAALVAFGTGTDEVGAAFKYIVMGSLASMLILFAIILTYGFTGTVDMAAVSMSFSGIAGPARMLITLLFLAGFFTKSAIVPFHAWLPDSYACAPSPVSAILAGVMSKAVGIYAISRIFFNVLEMTHTISNMLMLFGVISLLTGVIMALGQWDIKRLLAYHSISQIGYILLGLGLATPLGVLGGLFHLLNHSLFKPLLFLTAGSVEYSTGKRDLKELGGLHKNMPVTANSSLAASFAISGIPPFNGFWSKFFIIIACIQSGKLWFAAAAVIGSLLTLSSFMKVQKYVFFEKMRADLKGTTESPWPMGASMVTLALLCLFAGVFFTFVTSYFISPAVTTLGIGTMYGNLIMGVR